MTIHWLHWLLSKDALVAAGGVAIMLFRSWLMGKALGIAEKLTLVAERKLVKSEREAALWWHFRSRAAKQGHRPKDPIQCADDRCIEITR